LASAHAGFCERNINLFSFLAVSRGRTAAAGIAVAVGLAPGPIRAEDLNVVATIKPIHSLVAQVMGDVGTPRLLVGGAASPHTYSMKPSDARALNAARVVFRVSEEIEPFTRKIVASLPKSVAVVTLAGAPGLKLLDKRSDDTFEAHDHGHHDHGHKDHGHGHHDHDHGPVRDGHVWLDPQNAAAMVREIARALSEAAPQHGAVFQANAEKTVAGIDALTKDIEAKLAPVKGKSFVVFHDAYQYFEQRFGLAAAGAITVSPEVQPSAKRLSEIRGKIKKLGVTCVFAEPQFKSKLVATVIEGTGAKAGTLDPEGASVEPGVDAYAALMRNLSQGLTTCLGA
jgi:zinc transport system substrate-binding protein